MDGIQRDDPLQSIEEMEITPEEREQVLRQIESAIDKTHTPDRSSLAVFQADKRGLLFPLLINLLALLLIGSGVFLLFRHFEMRKESITLRRGSYVAAEGTLIQTLKQEAETRLQAKEEEIASIQAKLREVNGERQALKLRVEADLETKQEQLRTALEQELSKERSRLAALGASEARITDKLRDLENRQLSSIDRQIASYRKQLDSELQERERELLRSQESAQEALAQANRDRNQLLAQLNRQESEREAAEKRLRELTARLQSESLLKDQAEAVFLSMRENLRAERYAAALQDLQGLEDNPEVQSSVVQMLADLIRSRQDTGTSRGVDAGSSAAVAALEEQLAAKNKEIEELQDRIRAIVAASTSDSNRDEVLVQQLQERVDSLSAQLKNNEAGMRQLIDQVEAAESGARRLEGEIQSLQSQRDALSASAQNAQNAQADSFERGRDEALRDVLTFINLLSGAGQSSAETENQLASLARQDPLFRAATREIRILMAGGGSAGELASPYLFLGIVSSVSAGRVVIEAMVDQEVSAGSVIQIRRISEQNREITIAEGTVQQVRSGKITATFKPVASGLQGPAARDPVYIVTDGS